MDDFVARLTTQQQDTLRAALQKRGRGEKLSHREAALLDRHERSVDAERRRRIYATIPQRDWIELSGRQAKVLNEQELVYGVPVGRANIDLRSIARWIHEAIKDGRVQPVAKDELDLAGENSPGLERYRLAKAALAEIDLEVRRGRLLDREKLEAQWVAGAVALRNAGERLQRRFGDEAAELFNEGVQDFARVVNGAIHGGSQHTPADDLPERVELPDRAVEDRPPSKPPKVRRGRARHPKRSVRGGEVQD